jgi:hypothetical protein
MHADTREWFRSMVGKVPLTVQQTDPKERVKSAALTVAFSITANALEANGRSIPLPSEQVSRDFQVVLAFNYMVLREILFAISDELDLQDDVGSLMVLATDLLLQMRPIEELKKWNRLALDVCAKFEQNELENVKEFLRGLAATTEVYVIQLTEDKEKIRETNVAPMFASQLRTIISSVQD